MGLIRKRLATIAMAAGIGFTSIFGLSACGGNNNANTTPTTPSTNQTQVDENTANIEKLQQDLEELQKQLQENKGEIADLKNQISSNNSSIATILNSITTINSTISAIQAKLDNGEDVSSLQTQIDTLEASVKNLNTALNSLQATVENIQTETGKPVEVDLSAITSNIEAIQDTVNKLVVQSAVVNTFKNRYVDASLSYTVRENQNGQYVPYDSATDLQLYFSPNGEFVARSREKNGVMVKHNGLNFTKISSGEENVEQSTTSLYEEVENGINNASGKLTKEGFTYTLTNEAEGKTMTLTIGDVLGSNSVTQVTFEDNWTSVSTNYINYCSKAYFEEMQTQAKAQIDAVTYYDDIMQGIDKAFGNKYVILTGTGETNGQDGETQTLNGVYAMSNAKLAEKATIGTDEQYMLRDSNGTVSISYVNGEVTENEVGDVQPTKRNMAAALKMSLVDGISSITYNEETDEYVVQAGDSWSSSTLRVKLDDEMKVSSIAIIMRYNEDVEETTVYTITTATKAEFDVIYNEIEAKVNEYLASIGTNV